MGVLNQLFIDLGKRIAAQGKGSDVPPLLASIVARVLCLQYPSLYKLQERDGFLSEDATRSLIQAASSAVSEAVSGNAPGSGEAVDLSMQVIRLQVMWELLASSEDRAFRQAEVALRDTTDQHIVTVLQATLPVANAGGTQAIAELYRALFQLMRATGCLEEPKSSLDRTADR